MNNQEILDKNGELVKQNPASTHKSVCFVNDTVLTADLEYRSLSDIREIEELKAQVEFKIKEYMELSQTCSRYERNSKAHNLEQQALMCEWIRSNVPDLSNRNYMDISNKSRELRKQAKALKGVS